MRGRFPGNDVGGSDNVSVLESVVLSLYSSVGFGASSVRVFCTNLVNKLSIRSWTELLVPGEAGGVGGGDERVIGTTVLVTRARFRLVDFVLSGGFACVRCFAACLTASFAACLSAFFAACLSASFAACCAVSFAACSRAPISLASLSLSNLSFVLTRTGRSHHCVSHPNFVTMTLVCCIISITVFWQT